MEGEKRKAEVNDGNSREYCQKRAREHEEVVEEKTTVTEEEVDEFFAILSRIHVAVNYFKGKSQPQPGWRGSKVEANGGKKGEENVEEENVGFDLNADPGTG